jgi:23S rRNA (cytidine2498-2'-O)-methyltransferase
VIVVAYCRAGFEREAAIDVERVAAACSADAAMTPQPGAGHVCADVGALDLRRWRAALAAHAPVFWRSHFVGTGPHALAAPGSHAGAALDRVTPLVEAIAALGATATSLWVEFPDTNDGKALSTLARALAPRVEAALRARGLLVDPSGDARAARNRPRFHAFLADGRTAYVGTSLAESGSRWPMGIPRLRMPAGAPSRSTLKLAEAIIVFLGDDEAALLHAGQRAVDLGAAPGGWTWQLAQRGLRVVAVDNGVLKGEVARDPLVTHVRDDGFRYRPKRPVDWVVCDMIEQPSRVAALMARWIGERHARRAIFNLKLPMKQRYAAVDAASATIDAELRDTPARLAFRQLYHDREEVTGYLFADAPLHARRGHRR